MDKPTSMSRDDQKGSKIIYTLKSFPTQNLSHPRQYPEMCQQQVGILVLQLHFSDYELSVSPSSRTAAIKSIPRYNLQKQPQNVMSCKTTHI